MPLLVRLSVADSGPIFEPTLRRRVLQSHPPAHLPEQAPLERSCAVVTPWAMGWEGRNLA
jgi:hypothetical protein